MQQICRLIGIFLSKDTSEVSRNGLCSEVAMYVCRTSQIGPGYYQEPIAASKGASYVRRF